MLNNKESEQNLENDPPEEIQKIIHEPRYWFITIVVAVVFSIVVGGGVWWWMNGQTSQSDDDLVQRIDELEIQLVEQSTLSAQKINELETRLDEQNSEFSESEVGVSEWKTYRSDLIGVEFDYPGSSGEVTETETGDYKEGKRLSLYLVDKKIRFLASTEDFVYLYDLNNFTESCDNPFVYSNNGKVCKNIDIGGISAIMHNEFFEYECSPSLVTTISIANKGDSEYKNLRFIVSLDDVYKDIAMKYSCLSESAGPGYDEAATQSRNIFERSNLSDADLERLEIFDKILSTFKFINID